MTRRRSRRTTLLVVLVLMFIPQSAAHADTQTANAFRFIGPKCSWGATWINNEWGSPGLDSIATMDVSAQPDSCDVKEWIAERREIWVQQDLIGWDQAWGREFLCNAGPWLTNNDFRTHMYRTWWSFNHPCNTQWYAGDGRAAIWFLNDWRGDEQRPVRTPWVFVP